MWHEDRAWLFTDDEPGSPVTDVSETELGRYLEGQ